MERVLGVAIGIAVVCLLLSIIASHLQEVLAWFTARRAASLVSAIESMLGKEIAEKFFEHPLIKTISFSTPKVAVALHTGKVTKIDSVAVKSQIEAKIEASVDAGIAAGEQEISTITARPTYIPAALFSRVLVAVLCEKHDMCGAPVGAIVAEIQDPNLKRRLEAVLAGTEKHIAASTLALEQWYDGTMDRINGLYKQNTQAILLYIGIALAVLCNANLFSITENLWSSDDARTVMTTTAQMYSCKDMSNGAGGCTAADYDKARRDMTSTLETYIPIGYHHTGEYWRYVLSLVDYGQWSKDHPAPHGHWGREAWAVFWGWILNLAGWGLTGVAVSLGAPFWFDAVNKLINIRLAGEKPARTQPTAIGSTPPESNPIVVAPQVTAAPIVPVVNVVTPPAPPSPPDSDGGGSTGGAPEDGSGGGVGVATEPEQVIVTDAAELAEQILTPQAEASVDVVEPVAEQPQDELPEPEAHIAPAMRAVEATAPAVSETAQAPVVTPAVASMSARMQHAIRVAGAGRPGMHLRVRR